MNLPAFTMPDGCILLLLMILNFTFIHGYLNQGNRGTTPFALVALLPVFVLPLLFTFQKFVVDVSDAPRSQKFVADNQLQNAAGSPLFQAAIPLPVRFAQTGQYTKFLVNHSSPLVHDRFRILHEIPKSDHGTLHGVQVVDGIF